MSETRRLNPQPSLPAMALSLLAGVCVLQLQPNLQTPLWTSSAILMFLPVCVWWFYCAPQYRHFLAFLIGYGWALLFALFYLQAPLPESLVGKNILLEGVVSGLADRNNKSQRFNFKVTRYLSVDSGEALAANHTLPGLLRLSWYYHKNDIRSGERWRLLVRLKPPHGMQNPGGFDYEKWLYQQGIQATGYVKKSVENQRIGAQSLGTDVLREHLLGVLSKLPEQTFQGLLQALTIGHKSSISAAQWQVLRQTGTSHLMAISGLHIGLVAGLVFVSVRRLVPAVVCKYVSAPQVAALASLLIGGSYAMLAGFSVPTQRAFIMLLVLMLAILMKRAAFSLNTLSIALIAVLLINPISVLSVGFWLSFLAVLIITLVSTSRVTESHKRRAWLQGVRIQWLIALGMLPLSVLLFQQGSLISPLANMLVIPLVGMLIVPLALLASFSSVFSVDISLWLFTQCAELLSWVWALLEWFARIPLSNWQRSAVPLAHSALAILGVALLLMPRGFPLRYAGLILLLPMLSYQYPRPEQGAFWVQVLDVGQGLSVLVQTRDKALLYDAGAKYSPQFDIGQRVVAPYLNYIGLQDLDVLMISHADNDHAGGAQALLQMMAVRELIAEAQFVAEIAPMKSPEILPIKSPEKSPEKSPSSQTISACESGRHWQWNGVNFAIIQAAKKFKQSNNRSCVLKVWNAHYSVLLPGDIEKKAERMLLQSTEALQADVLIVPHHGSNTSSSAIWLDGVKPRLAIVSAGYKNRFGHPTQAILKRYQQRNIALFNTADSGQLQIKLPATANQIIAEPQQQRKLGTHYWNHRLR